MADPTKPRKKPEYVSDEEAARELFGAGYLHGLDSAVAALRAAGIDVPESVFLPLRANAADAMAKAAISKAAGKATNG